MITIGMDYYPEQWDESLWEADIAEMADLGVNVVRIGEFAWCRMEPSDGLFEFEWLDEVIKKIASHGMQIILGTPTNCPPMWLIDSHPEILQCERDGRRTYPGIRGHRCQTNPVFRNYAERIIREMASRYGGNSDIFAWQIDNEIESNHCTCPSCTAKFQNYLKRKYGTVVKLNRAWGTIVWSGEFTDFKQIHPLTTMPVNKSDWFNPAFILDCERFASESTAEYTAFQANIIREYDPDARITTNSCFGDRFQDFREQFSSLDVASYDNYPAAVVPEDPEEFYSNAFALDFVRSFKRREKKFWIMEELAGPMGCWGPVRPALEPGMIEGYALQAVAHGADLVSFFRWRTASSGAEMFCHGLLDHNGRKNRRYLELKHLIGRLKNYPDLEKTEIKSEAAILYSADAEYSFRSQKSDDFKYWTQLRLFHETAVNLGVNVDIIRPDDSFDGYRVLILPAYFVTDPSFAQRAAAFAENGGTVVVTTRSGVKDIHGNCIMFRDLPVGFTELCGCHVEESDAVGTTARQSVRTKEGYVFRAGSWCDIVVTDNAEVLAEYQGKYYAGAPAITRNRYGEGYAYYIGTVGEKAMYRFYLHELFFQAGVRMTDTFPEGVEAVTRTGDGKAYTFIFNNSPKRKIFEYGSGKLDMKPLEMKIVETMDES